MSILIFTIMAVIRIKKPKPMKKGEKKKTYRELLRDPRWQRKRLETFQRDGWRCTRCKEKTVTLHVHHKYYIKELLPWDHPDDCLVTLCENCHDQQHSIRRFFKKAKHRYKTHAIFSA